MFGRIGPEFECLERQGKNSNVLKDKTRMPMFGRIGHNLQCLEGQDHHSNV